MHTHHKIIAASLGLLIALSVVPEGAFAVDDLRADSVTQTVPGIDPGLFSAKEAALEEFIEKKNLLEELSENDPAHLYAKLTAERGGYRIVQSRQGDLKARVISRSHSGAPTKVNYSIDQESPDNIVVAGPDSRSVYNKTSEPKEWLASLENIISMTQKVEDLEKNRRKKAELKCILDRLEKMRPPVNIPVIEAYRKLADFQVSIYDTYAPATVYTKKGNILKEVFYKFFREMNVDTFVIRNQEPTYESAVVIRTYQPGTAGWFTAINAWIGQASKYVQLISGTDKANLQATFADKANLQATLEFLEAVKKQYPSPQ